ncbi:unnamed protein product [Rotaria sp. Silwood1]|nr:unnamed protein product [Rotaria sp. Silwood1]CAF1632074.1 unnamed protein product [Rotaria sp. Silwood1]
MPSWLLLFASCAALVALSMQDCKPGEYGIRECSPCPEGYYCPNGRFTLFCPPGFYSSSEGAAKCTKCDSGTYAPRRASAYCHSCLAGYYCDDPTSTPKKCPANSYSNDGAISCQKCQDGWTSQEGSSSCIPPSSTSCTG